METKNRSLIVAVVIVTILLLFSLGLNLFLFMKNKETKHNEDSDIIVEDNATEKDSEDIADDNGSNTNNDGSKEEDDETEIEDGEDEEVDDESNTFSNSKLSIVLEDGWTAEGLANGSVNIFNGSYILYVNPSFTQTSGVQGGRFDEISQGAPSANLVTVFRPAMECSTPIQSLTTTHKRYDVYTNDSVNADICKPSPDDSERWYFSYYVKESPYLTYKASGDESYVITLSMNVSAVAGLPQKGSSSLEARFEEANTMVDSLLIK